MRNRAPFLLIIAFFTAQRWLSGCGLLLRCRQAVAAIEFAFILPVFLALMIVMVEGANLFRIQSEMSAAVRDGSRRLAVGAMEPDQIEALIVRRIAAVTDAPVFVDVTESEIVRDEKDVIVEAAVDIVDAMLFDFFRSSSDREAAHGLTGGGEERVIDDPLFGSSMKISAKAVMLKE